MIINVVGYGSTGASAVVDLLKEYEKIQYYKKSMEFQIIEQPDGLHDLYLSLFKSGRINNSVAIKRFMNNIYNVRNDSLAINTKDEIYKLSNRYINSLNTINWKGKSNYDPVDIQPFFQKYQNSLYYRIIKTIYRIIGKRFSYSNNRFYSLSTEKEFISSTKKYIDDILICSGFDLNRPIVLEQALGYEHLQESNIYFNNNVLSIIVNRDPRDVYIITNVLFPWMNMYMPNSGDVDTFISYYRTIHKKEKRTKNVLYVNFEDLIYDYQTTCKQLSKFIGLKHIKPNQYFKPKYSVNNTMLFKSYPYLKDDIEKIEKELSEFIYSFDENLFDDRKIMVSPFEHQEDIEETCR